MTDANGRKRGSIALARELCVQIAGYTDDDQDQCGHDYGSVDIAEILSAEVERLREALAQPEQQAEPVQEQKYEKRIAPYSTTLSMLLNTAPPQQQAEQVDCPRCGHVCSQRPWAGLTEEDFLEACQLAERGNYLLAFQRIQAKLKEKNDH